MKPNGGARLIGILIAVAAGTFATKPLAGFAAGADGRSTPRGGAAGTFSRSVTTGLAAQARARAFDPELLRTGDLIRYRELTRDDFLAEDPPPESGGGHGEVGAATCVFLTTDPETYIRASSRGPGLRPGEVRARVENLRFLAYMDRECSWWNPAPVSLPAAYILRHEQIHFALFEIAARRLNARADALARELESVSTDQQRALQVVHGRIDAEMQRVMDEILARSNDFDRETSRTYRQDRQDWWWRSVSVELERLAAQAGSR